MKRPHQRPGRPGPARPGPSREASTEVVYGLRAGLAVLAARPAEVLRIAYVAAVAGEVEAALRRGPRVPAVVVTEREIERLAQSPHHEGLALETRPRRWASPQELADLLVKKGGVAIALDRVRNPYNVGAILRGAAFFGVDAALLGPIAPHPALEPNAVRVAEGGTERLLMSRTTDLADTLGRLRARGVKVFGADMEGDVDALHFTFPRPAVLVMGNEREGLGPRIRAQCDAITSIRGSGAVESLNVAVAAGVLIAQLTARR